MIKWLILAAVLYLLYRLIRVIFRVRRVLHIVRDGAVPRPQAHSYDNYEKDITDRARPVK